MAVKESDDDPRQTRLITTREPKAKREKSVGAYATQDAVVVVALAWLGLFALHYSLRHHII